jgi:hypothetical protein
MKCQLFPFFGVLFALAFAPGLTSVHAAEETALDTTSIEAVSGLKGVSNQAEGTFKVSKPRNDVAITVDQVRMAPLSILKRNSFSSRQPRSSKKPKSLMRYLTMFTASNSRTTESFAVSTRF